MYIVQRVWPPEIVPKSIKEKYEFSQRRISKMKRTIFCWEHDSDTEARFSVCWGLAPKPVLIHWKFRTLFGAGVGGSTKFLSRNFAKYFFRISRNNFCCFTKFRERNYNEISRNFAKSLSSLFRILRNKKILFRDHPSRYTTLIHD
jgi:hypothetical protein